MAFRLVGMTGRLQTESSLHGPSWDLLCPCSSTEHCLAQGAWVLTLAPTSFPYLFSVFFLELLGDTFHSFSWPEKCT